MIILERMESSMQPSTPQSPPLGTVALLGGSFDPPHVCHAMISLYVLQSGCADEVWWLPCAAHAFGKRSAPFADRLALCEVATRRVPGLRVDPIEEELAEPSYTLDTVRELRRRHPGTRFVWIAGTDLLPELVHWHRWSELADELDFVVLQRGDAPPRPPERGTFRILPVIFPDISSSGIRAGLAAGEDVRGLLDHEVWRRLRQRALYPRRSG
jgi:nicotinate-nucleotide adenylyltransferase